MPASHYEKARVIHMKKKLIVLVCLMMLCTLLPLDSLALRYGDVVRITHHVSLNVRKGPGTGYGVIGEVQPENVYPYLGTENGWNCILYTGDVIGYVSGNKTTIEPGLVPDHIGTGERVEAIVRVTHTNTLNVRKGPGKSYGVIGSASPDETFTFLGTDDGWNMIQYTPTEVGYIAANRTEVEVINVLPELEGTSGATTDSTSGATSDAYGMPCSTCDATGICPTCDGNRYIFSVLADRMIDCPSCLASSLCWVCNGSGID